ncbi:MAG TPA: hypothetical protein PK132_04730, partial [Dermatophilaceae bacterium]|nr:hypothetical protein [Dermatophilaceae bacterium]HOV00756.1 hypothetical protein [Dermatophilaceae bacterium]HPK88832.1 hypothetical protein [Dermatophilaceae bacterium]
LGAAPSTALRSVLPSGAQTNRGEHTAYRCSVPAGNLTLTRAPVGDHWYAVCPARDSAGTGLGHLTGGVGTPDR